MGAFDRVLSFKDLSESKNYLSLKTTVIIDLSMFSVPLFILQSSLVLVQAIFR